MRKIVFKKSLGVGIIILFIGASVIPSMGSSIVVRHDLRDNKTSFIGLKSRGYIQGLIDNASDGDTIYIPRGIYHEYIIINKSISLIGEDKDTTIIDGGGGYPVKISANWVNISRFTIQNGTNGPTPGILIYSCYNNITDNIMTHNDHGIKLWNSSSNIIKDNNCTNNLHGIVLTEDSSNNTIMSNTISNNYDCGILLFCYYGSCNDNTIIDNNISNNYGYGIQLG